MAVWKWYKGITPKTRIFIGLGIMAYAGVGMALSDTVEEKMGWVATEQDKEELKNALPKITVVDKEKRF
ncbi:hypothetical protein M011DRAFT_480813 [Sporormia fimetaria CBS 119925]|uniref:Uncharacterized protein n=1 Tax=Sporormia fimetaria CBS 119925 TaxID=1340428 RepID=A0A6A6V2N8_9PLEO|nr:hypothetical protein M011DRAFT_480813 [Sporormia fimetaria CBS 119925]